MDEMNTMLEMSEIEAVEPIDVDSAMTETQTVPNGIDVMTFMKGGLITAVVTWGTVNVLEFGKRKAINAWHNHQLKSAEKKARKATKKKVDDVIDIEAEIIE